MIECPQCGTMNEDDVKNCRGCRINMYWAFQHYEELAAIREANRLAPHPKTPLFLVETSKRIDEGPTVGWLRNTIKKFGFVEFYHATYAEQLPLVPLREVYLRPLRRFLQSVLL